jgi:hypothetical protein
MRARQVALFLDRAFTGDVRNTMALLSLAEPGRTENTDFLERNRDTLARIWAEREMEDE